MPADQNQTERGGVEKKREMHEVRVGRHGFDAANGDEGQHTHKGMSNDTIWVNNMSWNWKHESVGW